MINVTKTWLPDKKKYYSYIDEIYKNGWVTNNGPLVRELESRLAKFLDVKNIVLVANGTIALEIAYRLLRLSGEVVTTPFSFVATTSSLVSNELKPIFADIDPSTFNLDPDNIESKITPETSAIVPVHVFGNTCEIENIEEIAKKYDLKVIYDAAHAFNIKYKGESVLKHGDVSTLSFHATKLFHTAEGGALIINDDDLLQHARYLINFGIENSESIPELGTNAKMNEFEAAMGLCNLDDIEYILQSRNKIYQIYQNELDGLTQFQKQNINATQNYGYFPILLDTEKQLKKVELALNEKDIFPRRYFYPSLDTLSYIDRNQYCINSRNISCRILALPIYPGLEMQDQMVIIDTIKKVIAA
jgi:dTDP-4-amino-4,6-dideoxygalactose transaminase